MKNYCLDGCKELLEQLEIECQRLYEDVQTDGDEKAVNAYREKYQEYLLAKEKLEQMESNLANQN